MTPNTTNSALDTAPTDDIDAATTYNEYLTTHTPSGDYADLEEPYKTRLNNWIDPYMHRRRAEAGVSPLDTRLIATYVPGTHTWTHRRPTEDSHPKSFDTQSTHRATVRTPSINTQHTVINAMTRYGWQLTDLSNGTEESPIAASYETTRYTYELLRRLLTAGLTHQEALAVWTHDIIDLKPRGVHINDFLETHGRNADDDATHHLATALNTTTSDLINARDEGIDKLTSIDPELPDLLVSGRGGRPLPDELWTTTELEKLAERSTPTPEPEPNPDQP